MVEDIELDTVFHALAHAARRDMLRRLAGREQTVGQLAAPLTMSLAAASKHVKVLELAGLVDRRVRGREHVCLLAAGPLAAASEWLDFYERFWNQRLDNLDAMLRTAWGDDGEERV
jgi:DNA-binding transcriptional ArsR family regulator